MNIVKRIEIIISLFWAKLKKIKNGRKDQQTIKWKYSNNDKLSLVKEKELLKNSISKLNDIQDIKTVEETIIDES